MLKVSCAGAVNTVHHPDCEKALSGRSEMMAMPMAGTSQKIAMTASTMLSTQRDGRRRMRRFGDSAVAVTVAGSDAACTALILGSS